MIDELRIQNFKCLRDTSLTFEPLTVLIGPNDSGKTSILEMLQMIGQTTTKTLSALFQESRTIESVTWRREPGLAPSWELKGTASLDQGAAPFVYRVTLASPGWIASDEFLFRGLAAHSRGGDISVASVMTKTTSVPTETTAGFVLRTHLANNFLPATEAFASSCIYRLDPRAMRSASVPKLKQMLSTTGDNLAAILDGLLSGPDRHVVNDMEDALRYAMPTLAGFSTPPAPGKTNGEKTINFVLSGNGKRPVTIPCELASDGAMLLTAFLALASTDTPGVLLIEEPENGLHPGRLKDVVDLLRRMTTGEIGNKPRQIILTTHSPLLLNYARPEEVRIVQRTAEQGTKVTPMKKVHNIDELLEEFGIGELWYLLGEKGLVEGKQP